MWLQDGRKWENSDFRCWDITEKRISLVKDWMYHESRRHDGKTTTRCLESLLKHPKKKHIWSPKMVFNWPGSKSSHTGHHGRCPDGCELMVGLLHSGPARLRSPHSADGPGRTTEGSGTPPSRSEGRSRLQIACGWPQHLLSRFRLAEAPSADHCYDSLNHLAEFPANEQWFLCLPSHAWLLHRSPPLSTLHIHLTVQLLLGYLTTLSMAWKLGLKVICEKTAAVNRLV